MDRQAMEAKEMTKNLPFKERFINFWYYRKWLVIGIVAAVLIVALTIYEIFNVPQYDLYAGMYLEHAISDEGIDALITDMTQYSNDVNGDDRVTISMTPMIANTESETEELAAVQTRLMSELNSGDNMMFIVDQGYYDFLMNGDYRESFKYEFALSSVPELAEKVGYSGELYVLVKDLYPSEENNADKRLQHNNAIAIFSGISGHPIEESN